LHIEDQEFPKRCGHLAGKVVIPRNDFYVRLTAAVQAGSSSPHSPLIIARTDALQPLGLDEAIARMKGAFDLGVDVAFVEGITSEEDARRVVKELAPRPVLLNLATNGNTPNWTVTQARAMGFRVVIFPIGGWAAAVHALRAAYREIEEEGTDAKACGGLGPKELFKLVGLDEAMSVDTAAGGTAYAAIQK
jgi:2-methylisocitrate lyase-like PEP mutase family enzyme